MIRFFKGDTNGGVLSEQQPTCRITVDVHLSSVNPEFLAGLRAVVAQYTGSDTVTIGSIDVSAPSSSVVGYDDFKNFLRILSPEYSERQVDVRARVVWVKLFANTSAKPWCQQCKQRQLFSGGKHCKHMSRWIVERATLVGLGDVTNLNFGYKMVKAPRRDDLRSFLQSLHDTPVA
jgi:hypothetical protein